MKGQVVVGDRIEMSVELVELFKSRANQRSYTVIVDKIDEEPDGKKILWVRNTEVPQVLAD